MNIFSYVSNGKVFVDMEYIKGYAFKMESAGVNCALLSVLTANFGRIQDSCARFSRIECLLPQYNPA